jgi:coenzyme F420-reducing hydrogenase gamma subunit
MSARPKLGVFKFASCDGCQVSILNLDEALLTLSQRIEIAHFLEATSHVDPGPYDVALVEGSITTDADVQRIARIREASRTLITIGACATSGGIQALRNTADLEGWKRTVYPHPEWIEALATSTPIADHVKVDAEIQGCPVNKAQVLRVILRALLGASSDLPGASVCMDCKRAGHPCVVVTKGEPCMGPVTRAGCGALCPGLGRDCYGCFGPSDDPNPGALVEQWMQSGLSRRDATLRLRGIAGWRREFREAADRLEGRRNG